MRYIFDMVCPRCGKADQITTINREPPPHLNCGDCLMSYVEIIEFDIVNVTVLPGSQPSKEQSP